MLKELLFWNLLLYVLHMDCRLILILDRSIFIKSNGLELFFFLINVGIFWP
jgi:hypothetical protein